MSKAALVAGAFALAACASDDVDDTTGSRLEQPQLQNGTQPPPPIEAGDIAIAAQMFSHDIRSLSEISSLTVPQLVRFNGVRSIVKTEDHQFADIDTSPYTTLLRDRLLLGDREKLRFIEHTLPPLNAGKKHGKNAALPIESAGADYEVLAELRGRANAGSYRIQLEFLDFGSRHVLLNEVYRIRPELGGAPSDDQQSNLEDTSPMVAPASAPPAGSAPGSDVPPVPPAADNDSGGSPSHGGNYSGSPIQ